MGLSCKRASPWVNLWLVAAFAAFPTTVIAQGDPPITKEELVRRLESRVTKFKSFGVAYAGQQVFPEGSFNSRVTLHSDREETGEASDDATVDVNWPSETLLRDYHVQWGLLLEEQLSFVEFSRFVFSSASNNLVPYQRRCFVAVNPSPTAWIYAPRSGNPESVLPIPENTAEYLEGWRPESLEGFADILGASLFQSIGLVRASPGNPLLIDALTEQDIADLQQTDETTVFFVIANGGATTQQDLWCELRDDDSARITACTVRLQGNPVFELSYAYDDMGLAERIEASTYLGNELHSHITLNLQREHVQTDLSRELVEFAGVPVGGVIQNRKNAYFFIDSDGTRVQFDPRGRRVTQATGSGIYIAVGFGFAAMVAAFAYYGRSRLSKGSL